MIGLLGRFRRDRGGIAAIEFALSLPVMVLMFLGSAELSQALAVKRLVSHCAGTITNLVTQYSTISISKNMPDIFAAATTVLAPYPSSNAMVRVSLVTIQANGNAVVTWSQAKNGAPLGVGSAVTVPAGMKTPGTSLVYGETTYTLTPGTDFLKLGKFNLGSSVFMFPRSPSGVITLIN